MLKKVKYNEFRYLHACFLNIILETYKGFWYHSLGSFLQKAKYMASVLLHKPLISNTSTGSFIYS